MVEFTQEKLLKKIFKIAILLMLIIPKQEISTSKVMLGDINGDQKIDQTDLVLLLRHISATTNMKHEDWILKDEKFKMADITENNIIDTSDVLEILRYISANNSNEIAKKHPEWLELKEIESIPTSTPEQIEIEVKDIKLNKTKIELDMSGTKMATITPTLEPSNATDKKVTYSSSNEKIAIVDSSGKITARKNGTATIIAKTTNGKSESCTVNVKTSPKSIKVNKSSVQIDLGSKTKTLTLKATVTPSTSSDKNITWKSNNKKIAVVDKSGKVTVKSKGTAIITARTSNGKVTKCKLDVKETAAMALARLSLEYACTAAGCKYDGINSRLSKYGARFDGSRITFGCDKHTVRIQIKETEKMLKIYDKMVKEFPYLKNWYAACSPYVSAMVYYLGIDTNIKNESSNIKAAAAQDKYFAKSSSFKQIKLDSNKTFNQQCQPGDILTIDYGNNHGHTMIYVGNKLAQEYFPGTTGGMVEAGQTNGFYPGVTTKNKAKAKDSRSTWHCYRPIGSIKNK